MLLLKSDKEEESFSSSIHHNSPVKEDIKSPNSFKLFMNIGILEFASLDALFLVIRALDFITVNTIFLIPLFFFGSNVIYLLLSGRMLDLANKKGKKPTMLMGLTLLLFSSVLMIFPYEVSGISLFLIVTIFLLYGLSKALLTPLSRNFIDKLITENGVNIPKKK